MIEFGGGIGPASDPDGKRPNLQGMIKRVLRASGQEAHYQSVINSRSLNETADFLKQSGQD